MFVIAAACVALLTPGSAGAASVINGEFETGDLSGWQIHNSSTGGDWYVYSGSSVPGLFAPPSGSWAAVSREFEPDTAILYQDVALEAHHGHRLTLTVYYHSFGTIMVPEPNTLATDETVADNQQLRIDVVRPAAPIESVAAGDVLATVFASRNGDPTTILPTRLAADLTPFAGQTVRLRIANAVEGAVFNTGLDRVSIASTPPANAFGRGRLVRDRSRGTATLTVNLPGAGVLRSVDSRVGAAGTGPTGAGRPVRIRATTSRPPEAGPATIPLRPTAAGRRTLQAKGRLQVRLRVTFTPLGGTPGVKTVFFVLKQGP
jgi:hypothetical protein